MVAAGETDSGRTSRFCPSRPFFAARRKFGRLSGLANSPQRRPAPGQTYAFTAPNVRVGRQSCRLHTMERKHLNPPIGG